MIKLNSRRDGQAHDSDYSFIPNCNNLQLKLQSIRILLKSSTFDITHDIVVAVIESDHVYFTHIFKMVIENLIHNLFHIFK